MFKNQPKWCPYDVTKNWQFVCLADTFIYSFFCFFSYGSTIYGEYKARIRLHSKTEMFKILKLPISNFDQIWASKNDFFETRCRSKCGFCHRKYGFCTSFFGDLGHIPWNEGWILASGYLRSTQNGSCFRNKFLSLCQTPNLSYFSRFCPLWVLVFFIVLKDHDFLIRLNMNFKRFP